MKIHEQHNGQKEIRLEAQLCMVIVFSLMSAALFAETLLMGWEKWTLPIIAGAIVVMWFSHITQSFTEKYRVYMYLFLILVELFFYGSHPTSLFDMPILIILALGLFALSEEDTIPFWLVAIYLATLFYHIPVLKTITNPLELSRLGLDIVSVLAAAFLSGYAIHRRHEESRRFTAMTQELLDMNDRTENFLTNVSHELRTPINAVSGITEVLLKNETAPQKRDSLLAVQQAGRRLFSQISDILDYTEIDTDCLVVVEEPYLITSLINDIMTEVQMMHYADGLELIFDVDTTIPASLVGDAAKVRKILRHLIENGCKFTKEGGVYVLVQTFKKEYGVNLCISVCDTGRGIAEDERTRITAFYQSDASRTRKNGGLGLGLPIVQGLTLAMGGFLHIDEARGGGALVRVSIPQKIGDESPCMFVPNASSLCIACYLRPEKYSTGAIRDYYSVMIEHLATSLHIALHRITTLRDLKNIQQTYALTHVFVGSFEYADNPDYFENLPPEIVVAVIAAPDFAMPAKTRCRIIWKPFNSLPIVSILNNENFKNAGVQGLFQKRFVCPDVRALVVDDDEMNLIVAKGILGDYGMNVTTATSGPEALQICARDDFDLIFMDHMMPEMDGVEAMHQLQKLLINRPKMPSIIALTANAVSGAREMFLQEGFNGFVPKPIETNELEHVLKKLLPASAFVLPGDGAKTVQLSPAATLARATPETWLEKLSAKDVNTQAALSYCANSEDFYREMLTTYQNDAAKRQKELEDALAAHDMGMYEIKVHALKSASKTVGLDALYALSYELEKAAKAKDENAVREKHASLLALLSDCVQILSGVLGVPVVQPAATGAGSAAGDVPEAGAESACATSDAAGNTDAAAGAALTGKLTALKEALDAFEADRAEQLLSELPVSAAGAISQELSNVRALIADFELGKAADIVQTLLSAGAKEEGTL